MSIIITVHDIFKNSIISCTSNYFVDDNFLTECNNLQYLSICSEQLHLFFSDTT